MAGSAANLTNDTWHRLFREPLLHFLLLAAALFVVQWLWRGDDREVIRIDAETQAYLIEQRQELILRPLNEAEKRQIVEQYAVDEMLFREARKRGFDNSSRVRRLLIQNMRFFMAGDLPSPSEKDLRAFFAAHPERFAKPASVSFDHAFTTDDNAAAVDILKDLNAGADPKAIGGDDGTMSRRLVRMNARRLSALFDWGQAKKIMAIADAGWHGPYESRQGRHFLRLAERHEAEQPTFEEARSWVRTEWTAAQHRQTIDREIGKIRENYRVDIAPAGAEE